MSLTDVVVRNAKAQAKTTKLFDERGLYLEISPSGGKWWRLKYRIHGKEKRLSLGVYPDIKLKQAREGGMSCEGRWQMALTPVTSARSLDPPLAKEQPTVLR
jgi:hypothetical protein